MVEAGQLGALSTLHLTRPATLPAMGVALRAVGLSTHLGSSPEYLLPPVNLVMVNLNSPQGGGLRLWVLKIIREMGRAWAFRRHSRFAFLEITSIRSRPVAVAEPGNGLSGLSLKSDDARRVLSYDVLCHAGAEWFAPLLGSGGVLLTSPLLG
jgi:hypothetical protein